MTNAWWNKPKPDRYNGKVPKIEKALESETPKPGAARGHALPYSHDDWKLLEAVKAGVIDPKLVLTKMKCQACNVTVEVLCSRVITDNLSKWLCDNCLEEGFDWGSQIMPGEVTHYQLVKEFKDDTLMRRLDKSPNHRDLFHDNFDPEDRRRIQVPAPDVELTKDPLDGICPVDQSPGASPAVGDGLGSRSEIDSKDRDSPREKGTDPNGSNAVNP